MRLLNTYTGWFEEVLEGLGEVGYAILSHTWNGEEQTYQEVREIQKSYENNNILQKAIQDPTQIIARQQPTFHPLDAVHPVSSIWNDRRLSPKIRKAAAVARKAGCEFIWIDICCIDKTSSSELSEAINSMYKWYGHAKICYAFLNDVPFATKQTLEAGFSDFRKSRWFLRGWTLQELIAPLYVTFLSNDWKEIGTKHTLVSLIEEITRVPEEALLHFTSLDRFSVAQRFSWAAERETKRPEDNAYSLLGIFDINMPTLYGEGTRAFRRLQEEILRRVPDQSLYAWKHTTREVFEREKRVRDLEAEVEACRLEKSNWRELQVRGALRQMADSIAVARPDPFVSELKLCGTGDHTGTDQAPCRICELIQLDSQLTKLDADLDPEPYEVRWRDLNSQLDIERRELINLRGAQRRSVSLFAIGPADFTWGENNIKASSHVELSGRLGGHVSLSPSEYTFTPHGIRTAFPIIPLQLCVPKIIEYHSEVPGAEWYLVILGCRHDLHNEKFLGRVCYIPPSQSGIQYLHSSSVRTTDPDAGGEPESLCMLPLDIIKGCHDKIEVKTVYIPHPEHGSGETADARHQFHWKLLLMMPGQTRKALQRRGYDVFPDPDVEFPSNYWLEKPDHTIMIDYTYTLKHNDNDRSQMMTITARVQVTQQDLTEVLVDPVSVTWADPRSSWNPWQQTLPKKEVVFTTMAGQKYKILLGMIYAPRSYYGVDIDVVTVDAVETLEGVSTEPPAQGSAGAIAL